MQIYLPIAEVSVNIYLLLIMGSFVGFLSGMFGVGGGFLMTPLLIFVGIPPSVAVATEINQILASAVSGGIVHWMRRTIDVKMGIVLVIGGLIGSYIGVTVFTFLHHIGQIDLVISICYILFLGVIGILMLAESLKALYVIRKKKLISPNRSGQHSWFHGLPLKMRFRTSHLYISIIPPIVIGIIVGLLAAIMGVGGGFIMIPAMIYILRMPTDVVIGTSLFQIIFVTAVASVLHSVENQSVDLILALILLIGGVTGAQFGVRVGQKLYAEQLRAFLAMLVLCVCCIVVVNLVMTPENLYSFTAIRMR